MQWVARYQTAIKYTEMGAALVSHLKSGKYLLWTDHFACTGRKEVTEGKRGNSWSQSNVE